jgi:hypothetical protein
MCFLGPLGYGQDNPDFNSQQGQEISPELQTGSEVHLASYSQGIKSSFPSSAMRLTFHHHLLPRLGMVVLYL